jgi:hypothetical protein
VIYGDVRWDFDGQEIFKRAVHGMTHSSAEALVRGGVTPDAIDRSLLAAQCRRYPEHALLYGSRWRYPQREPARLESSA